MSTSKKEYQVSLILTDFLGVGQEVVGALTEVPYVGPIFQIIEKIAQIRDEVNANKDRGTQLLRMVQSHARTLINALDKLKKSRHSDQLRSIEEELRQFESILVSILQTLANLNRKGKRDRLKQLLDRVQVKEDIKKCERELQGFHERFTIGTLIKLAMNVFEASELSSRRQTLAQLPYADRASWNRDLCCLPGTRQDLLQSIYGWINRLSETKITPSEARILWLQGPAGSGKSAVAHSLAAWATDQGILVSSFFLTPGTTSGQSAGNQGAAIQPPSTHNLISTLLYDLSRQFPSFADAIAEGLHNKRYLLSDPQRQFTELLVHYAHLLNTSKPLLWIIDGFDELRRFDKHSAGFSTRDVLRQWEFEVPKLPNNFLIFVTSRPFVDRFLAEPSAHLHTVTIDLASKASRQDVDLIARAKIVQLAEEKGLSSWPEEAILASFVSRAGGLPLWVTVVTNFLRNSLNPQYDLKQILTGGASNSRDVHTDVSHDMSKIYNLILDSCADWERKGHQRWLVQILEILLALKRPLSLDSLCELCDDGDLAHALPSVIQPLRPVLIGVESHQPIEFIHLSFWDFLISPSQKIILIDRLSGHATLSLCCFHLLNKELNAPVTRLSWDEYEGDPDPPFPSYSNPSTSLLYSSAHVMEHLRHFAAASPGDLRYAAIVFLSSTLLPWLDFQTRFGEYYPIRCVADRVKVLDIPAAYINRWIASEVVAEAIMDIGSWLNSVNRLEESLESYTDSTWILRKLASRQPQAFNPDLAMSLNNLSNRLYNLGSRDEALMAIQEAVELYRRLRIERPQAFNPGLAMSLSNLSLRLSDVGSREEALSAIQEAVEIRRQLASERSQVSNVDLASSLNNLSNRLSYLDSREEALTAMQEAVEIRRQLASDRPQMFNANLASSLNNLSLRLSDLNFRDEALSAIQEAVEIRRHLASERPEVFIADLATSLNNLSSHLSELGSRDEALAAIQEAVNIRRQLVSSRPQAFNADLASSLAMSLSNLSSHLSNLGFREEALAAIQEAVDICRQLGSESPRMFNANLASSLSNLSLRLSDVGFREQALSAIQEAVEIRRQLASERPQMFNANLASSLNNLSIRLSDLSFRDEALLAIQEAVEIRRQLASEHPQVFNADLAISLNNLSSHLSEVGSRDEALAAIQEAVEIRRQLVSARPQAFNADLASSLAMSLNNLSSHLSNIGSREDALAAIQEAVKISRQLAAELPQVFNPALAQSLHTLTNCLSDVDSREEALKAVEEAVELHRRLASEYPRVFNPDLAESLCTFSSCLDHLEQLDIAFSAVTEAVRLYKALAVELPMVFQSKHDDALSLLSRIQDRINGRADGSSSTSSPSET